MRRTTAALRRIQLRLQQQRIRFHLKRVEIQLGRTDTCHLSTAQRLARRRNLEVLRAYRERGRFPINTDNPRECVPHLKDRYGTYCAVAHLVCASGGQSLIDELSEQDNRIRIRDVDDGPLLEWLHENGLSRREAETIQPAYGDGLQIELFMLLYAGSAMILMVTFSRLLDLPGVGRDIHGVLTRLGVLVTSLLVAVPAAVILLKLFV